MTNVGEQELLQEWQQLVARHATVCGALEAELQRRHSIGVNEFEVLERLFMGDHGKCRGAELSDAVHLSQSAASRLVARLEREGLVFRAMCEMDRRGIFVSLTDAGRERYHAAKPTHREVLAATLGDGEWTGCG